ncbi:extracellular solute-binding protein (plasmid) [Paenibacillus rhizovicinus]|uniref:Extracellular solute-binding protein n=1 Tax=Paenibacillus rhizovicinus TaxID=2704463 RepID=A0A6C0PAA5_9BACL|nr:extracellular solute-binding protein [Paenibacillus rhizovicinus]QHW35504.1 extracellular solute-binding protein [Paenibacillus rhizovicinus]
MRKWMSIVLSVALVASIITGCTTQKHDAQKKADTEGTNKASNTGNVETAQQEKGTTNEFGWAVPEKTINIDFYAGQDNPEKQKQAQEILQKWLLDHFNVRLNGIYYDVNVDQKLNLMLASGDYPEVITNLSEEQAARFISRGKAVELTPYIDKIAPNIRKKLGDLYKSYLNEEGKLFYIPKFFDAGPFADFSAHIRYDWWKELGSPVINTPDDYFEVMKKMQAAHPKNAKGEKTYALSGFDMSGWGNIFGMLNGIWGLKDGYKEENGNLVHWINTPEGLEMTKYINRYNVEGLLDPDMFINKYDDWKAKFSNERIMGELGPWWVSWNAGHEVWQKSDPHWTDEKRYVQISIKAPSAEKAYLSPQNRRGGLYTIITDKAKDPEAIMKWLNFAITDTGSMITGWGPPNLEESLWTYKDGKFTYTEGPKKKMLDGNFDFTLTEKLGTTRFSLSQSKGAVVSNGESYFPYAYDAYFNKFNKWRAMMDQNLKETVFDNTLQSITIPPTSDLGTKDQQITDALNAGWAKAVLSKSPEECEKAFMELRDKVNKMGMHDLEKYRTEVYQQRLKTWK